MRVRILAVAFCLGVALPSPASAESIEGLFHKANNAFWNGEYQKAAETYAELEELGVRDADVYYNRGTAEARMGRLGRAVLMYERALRQDPGHEDAQYNLEEVREFIAKEASERGYDADIAPEVTAWRALLDRFTSRSAAIVFLLFHMGLFAVLLIRRLLRADLPRMTLGVLAGVLALMAVLSAAVVVGKWNQHLHLKEAIVVSPDEVFVVEGPESRVKRFELIEGARVEVLDRQGLWIRIHDAEGRDGWARARDFETI